VLNNLMPDVAAGATPIAFGNWNQAYIIVNRRGVTVQNDPFSAGWCNLFKFDARIGGSVVCPNAAAFKNSLSSQAPRGTCGPRGRRGRGALGNRTGGAPSLSAHQ